MTLTNRHFSMAIGRHLSLAIDGQVATASAQVTDADFARAKGAGFTDDQLFELVVCAAVGEATRQYETGLAVLAEAAGDAETE